MGPIGDATSSKDSFSVMCWGMMTFFFFFLLDVDVDLWEDGFEL